MKYLLIIAFVAQVACQVDLMVTEVNFTSWGHDDYEDRPFNPPKGKIILSAKTMTLSGFSEGASQAANMMAFYNDNIDGLALMSGRGPCATFGADVFNRDSGQCWVPKDFVVDEQTHMYPTQGYKDKPVFISVGTADEVANQTLIVQQKDWHQNTVKADVNFTEYQNFGHAYSNNLNVSEFNINNNCTNQTGEQFNCGQDMARDFLNWTLADKGDYIQPMFQSWNETGKLYQLDVSQSIVGAEQEIANYSFIYVPDFCNNTGLVNILMPVRCDFHIHFHGEKQSAEGYTDYSQPDITNRVNTSYIRKTGILEYAASNNIIVLFPQSNTKTWIGSDPQDLTHDSIYTWNGFSQSTKEGKQAQAIVNIVKYIFTQDLFNDGIQPEITDVSIYLMILICLCVFVTICSGIQYLFLKRRKNRENSFGHSNDIQGNHEQKNLL